MKDRGRVKSAATLSERGGFSIHPHSIGILAISALPRFSEWPALALDT